MIAAPMALARGFTFLDHGQSARGADHSPGSPRCTLSSAHLCQEAADQTIDNLAYGLPGPVGEVLISTREALDLHAPSIRMETENDVQVEPPKSSSDVCHHR